MPTAVFIDTNALYDYGNLENIDWRAVLPPRAGRADTEVIVLVLTQCVLREVQRHKDGTRGTHRTKRSEALLRGFARLSDAAGEENEIEIRPRVLLRFDHSDPIVEKPLNPEFPDEQLVAAIQEYRAAHPDDEVYLVTGDNGMALIAKAKTYGIARLRLPQTYAAAVEADPVVLENQRLKRELNELANRLPVLSLTFPDGMGDAEVEVHRDLGQEDVPQLMRYVRRNYPLKQLPGNGLLGSLSVGDLRVEPGRLRDYNAKLNSFYEMCEAYLRARLDDENERLRFAPVTLCIANTGTATAADVDVTLRFPAGSHACFASRLPGPTFSVQPPDIPTASFSGIFSSDAEVRQTVTPARLRRRERKAEPDPGTMEAGTKGAGATFRFHRDKVKHHEEETLGMVFVWFGPPGRTKPVSVDYEIRTETLGKIVTGKLLIRPKTLSQPWPDPEII